MDTAAASVLQKNLYLVGMMGSGKTHWGKKLGAHFGAPCHDLDAIIEATHGITIADFFARHGESAFRKAEAAALRQMPVDAPYILSTGGGTPCFEGNMAYMLQQGLVIWLNIPIETLVTRLQKRVAKRPVLAATQGDPVLIEALLRRLMTERSPWYGMANAQIDSAAPNIEMFLNLIQAV